ncbi:MAG: S-layer homology domain-containing protein [Clostridia bacterium]|nr:S-layer homology domain-containing protein [Clostridia bacterium]
MKKFLVVLSILVLTLSLSNIVLAKEFSDVKNTKYSDSVEMLTELKIINGYDDNTFKPNNQIKRSEMAKLLILSLGKQSEVKTKVEVQTFPDVPTGHWAAGYIELASQLDLIKGYPNGKFAPDDKVSYVEAVALMLRALNYNKEIESLTWPDGYMKKASDIKLLKSVTYNNSNDDATRGEIANMLWNTMNAYTRTVVATNTSGNVYGNSKILLEKSFPSKYTSITDSVINDIDLVEETITVKVDGKNKDFEYKDATETELKKMFGRTIEYALYDQTNKKFLSIEFNEDEKLVSGNVSDVTSSKISIGSKEYDIPDDDNIKLIGISDIDDAEKVYIVMNGSKVKYMLAEGTEKLYIGLVMETDVDIDGEEGIAVEDEDGDEEEYVLANSKAKIYEGDTIIYALNSDDELVLKKAFDYDDGMEIDSVTSTSIKLKGKSKVTFSKSDDYIVILVNDDDSIEEIELEDIYVNYDSAVIETVNETTFVIVFADGLEEIEEDDDDDDVTMTKSQAKTALKNAIKTAKNKKEASYTIASWAKLETALKAAEAINTSTATASKMQSAAEKLETAINSLKKVTTADKNLRTKFYNLQDLIDDAEDLNKDDYTSDSYAKVTTALTAAKKISITSTTVAKVETAISNLDSAIKLLVTNTTAENMESAKERLEKAKTDAAAIKKEDYTEETYKDLEDALKAAEKIDYAKDGSSIINNAARNIEEALVALISKADDEKDKAINKLKEAIVKSAALNESKYTASTWAKLEDVLDDIKPYNGIFTGLTTSQINTLESRLTAALNGLEEKIKRDSLIGQLESIINTAEEQEESTWGGSSTWADFQTALTAAKSAYEARENKTYSQLETVYDNLCDCLGL